MTTNQLTDSAAIDLAIAHATREGRADYTGRALDVASGETPDWAWPLTDADDAYISALGTGTICESIGISAAQWEAVSDAWCQAFRDGYIAAHGESETGHQVIALKPHTVPHGEYFATWSGYELRVESSLKALIVDEACDVIATVQGIRGAIKVRVQVTADTATVLEDLGPANPWEV